MEPSELKGQYDLFGQMVTTQNPGTKTLAPLRPQWMTADCTLQGVVVASGVRASEKWKRDEAWFQVKTQNAFFETNRSSLTNQMVFRYGNVVENWVGKFVRFEKGELISDVPK